MDHAYAAPAGDCTTGVASYLLDHNFAKPPSESPIHDKLENSVVPKALAPSKTGKLRETGESVTMQSKDSANVHSSPRTTLRRRELPNILAKARGRRKDSDAGLVPSPKKDPGAELVPSTKKNTQEQSQPKLRTSPRDSRKKHPLGSQPVTKDLEIQPSEESSKEVTFDIESDDITFQPVGFEIEHRVKLPSVLSNTAVKVESKSKTSFASEGSLLSKPHPDINRNNKSVEPAGVVGLSNESSSVESNNREIGDDEGKISPKDIQSMAKDGSTPSKKWIGGDEMTLSFSSDPSVNDNDNSPHVLSPRVCLLLTGQAADVQTPNSATVSRSASGADNVSTISGEVLEDQKRGKREKLCVSEDSEVVKKGGATAHENVSIRRTDKDVAEDRSEPGDGDTNKDDSEDRMDSKSEDLVHVVSLKETQKKSIEGIETDKDRKADTCTQDLMQEAQEEMAVDNSSSGKCDSRLEVDGDGEKEATPSQTLTGRKRSATEAELDAPSSSSQSAKKVARPADHAGYPKKQQASAKKVSADVFDEKMVWKPLKEYGWIREVVIRGVFDERKKTPCDVYYFTPEGKKLRSRVMIAQYLGEHHETPLTIDNFTFVRKPILKEPWEVVRRAGTAGRRPSKSPANKDDSAAPGATAPQQPKSKKGRPPKPTSPTATPPTTVSGSHRLTASDPPTSNKSLDEEDLGDGDSDYDPYSESTPKWGRNKTKTWNRKCHSQEKTPNTEILIMSMPPPEVIIDRAEESHTVDRHDSEEAEDATETEEEDTKLQMVLLPDEIKQSDSDEDSVIVGEDEDQDEELSISHSAPEHRMHPKQKPTARKSTMPRIALRFTSKLSKREAKSRQHSEELVLSEGQLCSNSCPGLDGQPPQLQCCVCMCLFHHKCVSVDPAAQLPTFKCLRCKNLATPPRPASPPKMDTTQPFMCATMPIPPPPLTTRPVGVRSGQQPTFPAQLPVLNLAIRPSLVFKDTSQGNKPSMQQLPIAPAAPRGPKNLLPPPSSDAIEALRNLMAAAQPSNTSQLLQTTVSPPPPRLLTAAGPPPLTPSTNVRLALMHRRGTLNNTPRPPPRLTAAPGIVVPTSAATTHQSPSVPACGITTTATNTFTTSSSGVTVTTSATPMHAQHAQLLTLPPAITSRLNLAQPLALRINNTQIVVPPSCVISSQEGLKVLLPPSTFPLPSDPNTKLSVTLSNNPVSSSPNTAPTTVTSSNSSSSSDHSSRINTSTAANDKGRSSDTQSSTGVRTRRRKQKCHQAGIDPSKCMMHRLFGGFDSMLHIFRHLGVLDLLQASQVCKTWLQIARQRCLWQYVCLEGLQVPDWDQATHFLQEVDTRSLCLKGMGHWGDRNRTWHQLMSNLGSLTSLRHIEFGQVPASVIHSTVDKLTQLEVFRAEHITDFSNEQMWTTPTKVDIGKFASLSKLQELRLQGVSGIALPTFTFSGNLSELANLHHLHTLSLTSLCALRDSEFHFLGGMKRLEVLELGDCLNWTSETYHQLGQLHRLRRLKLEVGGDIPDAGLGDALSQLTNLQHLELILFAIPASVGSALRWLHSLHTLVVWPDAGNSMMPALVNSHALAAVHELKQLSTLEWGVVIRDAADSHSSPASHSSCVSRNSSIPLLKQGDTLDPEAPRDSDAIRALSVTDFTQTLCASLPHCTKIKVFNTQVLGRSSSGGNL